MGSSQSSSNINKKIYRYSSEITQSSRKRRREYLERVKKGPIPIIYFGDIYEKKDEIQLSKIKENLLPMIFIRPSDEKVIYNKYLVITPTISKEESNNSLNTINIYDSFKYFQNLADDLNVCIVSHDYFGTKYVLSMEICLDYLMINLGIKQTNIFLVGYNYGSNVVFNFVKKNYWLTNIFLVAELNHLHLEIIKTISCPLKLICLVNSIEELQSLSAFKQLYCINKEKILDMKIYNKDRRQNMMDLVNINEFRQFIDQ